MYEGGSNVDQFVTRFLLKETANQIQSLLSSVESAVEAIEEQTSQIRCVRGTDWGTHSSLTLCAPQIWVHKFLHLSVCSPVSPTAISGQAWDLAPESLGLRRTGCA